jgi:hypothetical protein
MPWPLYPQRKTLCYPLDRRLGESQSQSRHRGGEEKNSQLLPGFKPRLFLNMENLHIKYRRQYNYIKCSLFPTELVIDN